MPPIIDVRGLSKSFTISHETGERHTALRDVMAHKARNLFSFLSKEKTVVTKEVFWALKDLNFEVQQGDRIGIIGRNGAGKSTLLKILSRITEPTEGRVTIRGRVASLLEVGTGFHPELTGRENVFLNGAIYGMSRQEIRKKFDEIVAFSEIEKFLDTPVKRYSSGMYVRLAFSVAAHLEPEILIVDEVLAVGDTQFQKKCIGKMDQINTDQGRTLLFVSHDLSAIERICNKGILLSNGQIEESGPIQQVLTRYSHAIQVVSGDIEFVPGVRISEFRLGEHLLEEGGDLSFRFSVLFDRPGYNNITDLALLLYDHKGIRISLVDLRSELRNFSPDATDFRLSGKLLQLNLVQGEYYVGLYAGINRKYKNLFNLANFEVKPRAAASMHTPYDPQHSGFFRIGYRID